MRKFGLIGKHIDYSFSRSFFSEKFQQEKINASYENCHLENIEEFRNLLVNKKWSGFNVTIPYKVEIIPFLDELSSEAEEIGAVNTIEIRDNKLIGHNTDYIGFLKSIEDSLENHHKKALVLGTGGASKAILFALKKKGIDFSCVSRDKKLGDMDYSSIDEEVLLKHQLIINCTPLGTFPKVDECPKIPYNNINESHFLYDLIYNPPLTRFLELGKLGGAKIMNGQQMLIEQALAAWSIWNKK